MSAVLHYFNGRGRAEIIRLTFAATSIRWTQVGYSEVEPYEKLKASGKLLFQQLPLVEYDGKYMVQSGAIARFFAKKGNLMGLTALEAYRIDALYEGSRDFASAFMMHGFDGFQEVLDLAKKTALPKYLPIFERELTKNGSNGYLVGSKLSLADLGLFEVIFMIEELMGSEELQPYPKIKKALETIKSIPSIAAYLSGPQRLKANDEKYVEEVKKVLKW